MPVPRKTAEDVPWSIRNFVAQYHRIPTRDDFNAKGNGLVSLAVVNRYFRQWQHAVKAAGFDPTVPV